MNTERALSKRSINNLDDCLSDGCGIRIRWHDRGKSFHDVIREVLVRSPLVFRDTFGICRPAGVSEMICSSCKGTWHNDGGFDTPAGELAGRDHGQCIHCGLRSKVRCKVGRSTTSSTATRDPDHQSLLLLSQLWQGRSIDTLSAE